MIPDIEMDLLRRVSADSMRVYEAVRRAQVLTAESVHILALAEDLMQQAGLAYLRGRLTVPSSLPKQPQTGPEELVSAYVQMQQIYTDLKNALYHLAAGQIAAAAWENGRVMLGALLTLEPEYRNAELALRQSYMLESQALFQKGAWKQGRMVLEREMAKYPDDSEIRIKYLESFVDERPIPTLQVLQMADSRVAQLPSFNAAIGWATTAAQYAKMLDNHLHTPPNTDLQQVWDKYYERQQEFQQQSASSARLRDEACNQLKEELAVLIRSVANVV